MNKTLESLFMNWVENYQETPKTQKTIDILCDEEDVEKSNATYDMLADLVHEEHEAAFSAGFNTAVQLFMGGSAV